MAAEQGDAGAQTNLGCMYMNGSGVEQSCAIARKWWTKAANRNQEIETKTTCSTCLNYNRY